MRSLPLGRHDASIYRNSPMNRYDVRCPCGWTAYADTMDEAQEAFREHEKEMKAPRDD